MVDKTTAKQLGLVIAIFGIIGVGFGLTGYFGIEYANQQFTAGEQSQMAEALGQLMVSMVFLQSILVTFFAGPTIGGLAGLMSGVSTDETGDALIAGGGGAFIGFYVMVFVAVAIMATAMSGGGGGGESGQQAMDMGQAVGPAIKAGIPTGVVGALAGLIGTRFGR